jgi:hypothetical protein
MGSGYRVSAMCTMYTVPVMGKARVGVFLTMLMGGVAMNIEHAIERSSAFVVIVVSTNLDRVPHAAADSPQLGELVCV